MNRKQNMPASNADHAIVITPFNKRVQVTLGGITLADSSRVLLLNETGYAAVLYFPRDDVDMARFEHSNHWSHCPFKGDANYFSLNAQGKHEKNIAWYYKTPYNSVNELKNHIAFYLDKVDAIYIDGVTISSHHELTTMPY
ncbi:MAG: DUF427 domain-containing protein [Gammaproteobacteria bacterium]|nr:DUF427 domain-containing protein [Gammaproteobacteria bacterium]